MKTILIMGSTSDEPHAKKITDKLDEYGIEWEQHAASAHKQPLKVLEILENNKEINLFIPNINYSTDNAAMIGVNGYFKFVNSKFGKLSDVSMSKYPI